MKYEEVQAEIVGVLRKLEAATMGEIFPRILGVEPGRIAIAVNELVNRGIVVEEDVIVADLLSTDHKETRRVLYRLRDP